MLSVSRGCHDPGSPAPRDPGYGDDPSLGGDLDFRADLGQPVEHEISCGTYGFLQPAVLVLAHIVISLEESGVCFRNKAGYDLGLYSPIYVKINKQTIQPEVVLIEDDIIIKINN